MSDEHDVPIDTMQEPVAQGQPEAPWEWMKQLDELLVWLQHRWLPLAAIVLFSSLLLFQSYVSKTGIVVSLSGAETLALMPIVFAMAAFAIVVLSFVVAAPVGLLITRLSEERQSLGAGFMGLEKGSERRRVVGNKLLIGWFLVWGALWVIYLVMLYAFTKIEVRWNAGYTVLFLMVAISSVLSISYVYSVRVDDGRNVSFEYLCTVVITCLSQILIITFSLAWSFEYGRGIGLSDLVWAGWLAVLLMLFLAICLVQLLMAVFFIKLRRQYNLFKGALIVALAVLVGVSFWPQLGGFLMSKTFIGEALGEKACVQLLWREAEGDHYAELIGVEKLQRSVPLTVLADIGGTLQVRPVGQVRPVSENNQVVYLVPVSELAAVESCPRSADE